MSGWMKHKLESKLPEEISIISDNADDTTLMAESEEELKSLLMKLREESGLKLNIQKTKIMASSPITPWQIDGEKVEPGTDFLFLGSKVTAMVTAAMKLKDNLLGRKTMANIDSVLKSRDIDLPKRSVYSKLWFFQ